MGCKGSQEQLSLIKPAGPFWRKEHPNPTAISAEKLARGLADMTGPVVPDEVNAARSAIVMEEVGQCATQVSAIIPLQEPTLHHPAMHHQSCSKIHHPMPDVVKLLPLDLAGSPKGSGLSLHSLEIGLFVPAKHQFVALKQAPHMLITPQYRRCPCNECLVQHRGFPVTKAMRLEVGPAQNERHCGMGDLGNNSLAYSHPGQSPRRPMRQAKPNPGWLTAGQLLDTHPAQGGKSCVDGRFAAHPTQRPSLVLRSAGTNSKWLAELVPVARPESAQPCEAWSWPEERAPGGLRVARCGRLAPMLLRRSLRSRLA